MRRIRALEGPNVFSHHPMLVMELDLEDLAGIETREKPPFNKRLLELIPGLREHGCASGVPGALVLRMEEGTYFGHVIEHVALELSVQAGIAARHGKTIRVSPGSPRVYDVAVDYTCESAMRFLLHSAVDLTAAVLDGRKYQLGPVVEEARDIVARSSFGPSTAALVDAAIARGIPCYRLSEGSVVQLGYGKYRQVFSATLGSRTSVVATDIAGDKQLTKDLLARALFDVHRGRVVWSADEAVEFLREVRGPVVVKPVDGHQGRGVSLRLETEPRVRAAYERARRISHAVLVEEQLQGRDYRVVVVGNRVVAASERFPPAVLGDGARTIRDLVTDLNRDPLRGESHERPLTRVTLDESVRPVLESQGLDFDSVPAAGRHVRLQDTANLSTGGTATDVTDDVHPEIAEMCVRATRVIGLDVCGVDLILRDIAAPPSPGEPCIIELNAAPGIRMHLHPGAGKPRDVGGAIVDLMFPPGAPCRIPIVSITGTNGKTTVTRMVAHVLSAAGSGVGMATTDGLWIAERLVARGDLAGPQSARTILGDPAVDVAVLETARGGIVRGGLGYDWSDVGVITNVQLDHVGQDGIETLDDVAHVKSLVAERVREGGRLVLNADDPVAAGIARRRLVKRVPKEIVFYSLQSDHLLLKRHVDRGGTVYGIDRGWVVECGPGYRHRVIPAGAPPATIGGVLAFNLSNLLAAVAACRGLGLPLGTIADALRGFGNHDHNPGRFSIYSVNDGYLVLDYGHNPAAIDAVGLAASFWGRRTTAVITVPGDRADEVLAGAGREAARAFDRLIIREDDDRRGRSVGEIARLIRDAAVNAGAADYVVVLDEGQAIRTAIEWLRPGEVAIVFYDKLVRAQSIAAEYRARPVSSIPRLDAAQGRIRLDGEQETPAGQAG